MGYTPPYLEVRKITGGYSMYPPTNTTTDDLTIFPNGTDTYAYVKLEGASALTLCGNTRVYFANSSVVYGGTTYSSPDFIIEGQITDKNIFLKPAGTGVVKFGTYTAGAATDSTGYITILDAAGNTRKLMVQA